MKCRRRLANLLWKIRLRRLSLRVMSLSEEAWDSLGDTT